MGEVNAITTDGHNLDIVHILLATGALRLIKSFYLNLQLTVQFSHSICRVLTHCYSISHTDKTKLYS